MARVSGTTDFFSRQWRQCLSRSNAPCAQIILEALSREDGVQVNGRGSGIRDRNPRVARNEHDGVRAGPRSRQPAVTQQPAEVPSEPPVQRAQIAA